MWGCFYAKSLGPIVLLHGILNQNKYVDLLANKAIPWLESQCYVFDQGFIYQEDGAPIHTGQYAKLFKKKTMVKGRLWYMTTEQPRFEPYRAYMGLPQIVGQ